MQLAEAVVIDMYGRRFYIYVNYTSQKILHSLKNHCNGKIVDLIVIATEQHLRTRLNGAFSFSISCLVSEIFRFSKHAN